jgi:hypothetical protein
MTDQVQPGPPLEQLSLGEVLHKLGVTGVSRAAELLGLPGDVHELLMSIGRPAPAPPPWPPTGVEHLKTGFGLPTSSQIMSTFDTVVPGFLPQSYLNRSLNAPGLPWYLNRSQSDDHVPLSSMSDAAVLDTVSGTPQHSPHDLPGVPYHAAPPASTPFNVPSFASLSARLPAMPASANAPSLADLVQQLRERHRPSNIQEHVPGSSLPDLGGSR